MEDRDADVFVANTTFATQVDGTPVVVRKGRDRVRRGHELLRDHPGFFDPVDLEVTYDVEQATQAPGEKRGGRKTPAGA